MGWIRVDGALVEHPKVRKAARLLDVHPVAMVGHLATLWGWASQHAQDGDVSRYDAGDLSDAARWAGEPEAFVKALTDCGYSGPGFLEPGGKVGDPREQRTSPLALHDWWDFAGVAVRSAKSGAFGNHVRWHVEKGVAADGCEFCHPIPPESPPSPPRVGEGSHPESPGESTTRHDTTRHENPAPPSTADVDSAVDDTGFAEFWAVYPPRDGKRIGKADALVAWRKLNLDQRRRAFVGARNLAASGQLPKDAVRFLRRGRSGGEFPFDDWQTPAVASRDGPRRNGSTLPAAPSTDRDNVDLWTLR